MQITQKSSGNSYIVTSHYVSINEDVTLIPDKVKNATPKIQLTEDGNIWINGYKFDSKKKTFKRNIFTILKCLLA